MSFKRLILIILGIGIGVVSLIYMKTICMDNIKIFKNQIVMKEKGIN